ncbi:AAA-domain-containing protein [Rhizopus microsporus var. microsporus]|nr:AAA-domain-containing protein [Rhizopus microsporus var. microsporus]
MAALNHTDHLELAIPHPGSCYLQDHIAKELAHKVKADLLVLDSFDFISLAQQTFHRYPASLLPMISAPDMDSNAMLAVKTLISDKEAKADMERLKNNIMQEVAKSLGSEDNESEEDMEDTGDDVDDTVTIRFNESDYDVNLKEFAKGNTSKMNASLLNQVSFKYTAMFKNALSVTKESKIIHLRDYAVMQDAFSRLMLKSLVAAVEDLKQNGHSIMIIASHSHATSVKDYFTPILPNMRSITLLPPLGYWDQWNTVMKEDETKRTAEINAKGLISVAIQKNALNLEIPSSHEVLINSLMELEGMSDSIWTLQEVDRRVSVAIGNAIEKSRVKLELQDFKEANEIVLHSSQLSEQSMQRLKSAHNMALQSNGSVDMDALKRTCNRYERKLLSRIVDPNKVQGSFKDVRAPLSTIETLQSLISLPLIRPDLFKQGILKKNFIPGVLLFGPPGTGKTMLAKAVAKESGSRMLDIQASDVYDMYVGQGEKNVKAIFSLARKLSPCVVFIDEVDSLMNKRGSDYSSKSHREIINQFMVEWDGLSSNNQGVIVMAATNRPFDLDDAVLRRMPRRILVDLPNAEDRLEILKILLKDEQYEVPLLEIAKSTEHYSGSDLKNVCVTAALKAIQEQVNAKTNNSIILTMEHFKEALKMVPPSLSEEMGTLTEIRKWDSQFGDGKKKKKTSIGFS